MHQNDAAKLSRRFQLQSQTIPRSFSVPTPKSHARRKGSLIKLKIAVFSPIPPPVRLGP
jgi:hypothetical protein